MAPGDKPVATHCTIRATSSQSALWHVTAVYFSSILASVGTIAVFLGAMHTNEMLINWRCKQFCYLFTPWNVNFLHAGM